AWLAAHPRVDVVENRPVPGGPAGWQSHGAGVDAALDWCRRQGARVMLHLEPDCLVSGTGWRENLLAALDGGASRAAGFRAPHGPLHPTPSAWRVAEVRANFRAWQWRVPDQGHPLFAGLVDLEVRRATLFPPQFWPMWAEYWDTGEKAWFEAAVCG